ncbi:MAG: hypothetical protein IT324_09705, partial [Anaerolineae bacterium]|nr:hypothetical protein [Anaerolineae bacterium]
MAEMRRPDAARTQAPRTIAYQFADVVGLLNYVHGLSQWIYTRPDADERDLLVAILQAAAPKATPGTRVPLYLTLPAESASWAIKPSSVDGAQFAEVIPADLRPLSWTNLALLLALQPSPAVPRRDDLVFVVQGTRSDLLGVLDAIFALEHEHAEDVSVLLAPVEPTSLGGLKAKSGAQRNGPKNPDWSPEQDGAFDPEVACLVKVSGLRRFYLLEKTITDPHLRLFYRHIFPPHVPVPPGLQVYVEWGWRYPLPPASFIMEAWQRDKLGLVLLPAPGTGEPLIVSSAITFRPVLHVAREIQITDWTGATTLTPVTAQLDPRLLNVQLRLQKRALDDTRENEQALRHRIQNDLWRLQRILAREQEAKSRRLYIYADNDPRDMARLRDFIMGNPLAILNEFRYFCGTFRDQTYHLVLLPIEDGSSVVTPDRFPDPPESARVFRREPAWAASEAGHELFIPRALELYPALAPGLENQGEVLKQALGMTAAYNYEAGKVMVLLWPDRNGDLVNYHIPLDSAGGFGPLGAAAESINTQALTPEIVQAVSA